MKNKAATKEIAKKSKGEAYQEDPWLRNVGVTPSQICHELAKEGLHLHSTTLRELEDAGLFQMNRTVGNRRTTTRAGAEAIKEAIWLNYTGLTREKYWEQRKDFEQKMGQKMKYEKDIIDDALEKEAENEKS